MRDIETEVSHWKQRLERPQCVWDDGILSRVRNGDIEAIHNLIERYHGRIAKLIDARLGRANVSDKEDLFQEALVAVFDGIEKPSSKADSEASFMRWLVLVVTRVIAGWLTKESQERQRDNQYSDYLDLLQSADHETDDLLGGFEMIEFLEKAIGQLPERDREYVRLQLMGLDRKEIAEQLQISTVTATKRWQRIIGRLRLYFQENVRW